MKTAVLAWLAVSVGFVLGAFWCSLFDRQHDEDPAMPGERQVK